MRQGDNFLLQSLFGVWQGNTNPVKFGTHITLYTHSVCSPAYRVLWANSQSIGKGANRHSQYFWNIMWKSSASRSCENSCRVPCLQYACTASGKHCDIALPAHLLHSIQPPENTYLAPCRQINLKTFNAGLVNENHPSARDQTIATRHRLITSWTRQGSVAGWAIPKYLNSISQVCARSNNMKSLETKVPRQVSEHTIMFPCDNGSSIKWDRYYFIQ